MGVCPKREADDGFVFLCGSEEGIWNHLWMRFNIHFFSFCVFSVHIIVILLVLLDLIFRRLWSDVKRERGTEGCAVLDRDQTPPNFI